MARQKRVQSETGIYHIILRGINKQQIFFENDDFYMFLNVLSRCKTVSGFKLYAYCIMNNHIHLLMEEGEEPLSKVFKRIGDSFIYRYNTKYDRIGGIFQGRYKSIPVNNDEYFISVLRYIHQNPVKAGIANSCSEYKFSSYNDYLKENSIVNCGFALELIGINEFIRIHNEPVNGSDFNFEVFSKARVSDEEAKQIIANITDCRSPEEFSCVSKSYQKEYVKQLRGAGLTIKQIMELTGVSQRVAQCRF